MIEPGRSPKIRDTFPQQCVICFFQNVIDGLEERGLLTEVGQIKTEMAVHRLFTFQLREHTIGLLQPGIGAPLAATFLENAIARGATRFVACGGAGALDADLTVGHLIVPTSALRDEGTSYHYLPPSRNVEPSPKAVAAIRSVLNDADVPFVEGKVWTTDAFFRETRPKVAHRKAEGCICVDMEASAFFAVAQFRNVQFGHILYAGDSLASDEWDHRGWDKQTSLREKLLWLAAEACVAME
ncbi:MAG: nucleoside phosphorylase [Lentisphaerae bacterium]|nr:nucleoside phosphorylase [Lentisphaerota bacterium]MBT4819766.1 nucleoside phosphorylase [Lentisphaerota bacterium]MBT5607552.1 nucleoside phosphorylase [Lentisphaerota bacterium]MBT7054587.1 nucleoside phosphorylase [Lentisphaerota bacterium]MBT7845174.1 nucleoside phosphorylase [Lentisphaerota bacterium]